MFRKTAQKPGLPVRKVGEQDSHDFELKTGIEFAQVACKRIGYLANVKPTTYQDPTTGADLSAILLFFLEQSGQWTKAIYLYQPYFYLLCADEVIKEIVFYLNKQYEQTIASVEIVRKEDLTLVNHLSGKTQAYIKLQFRNVQDLMTVRQELFPLIKKNKANRANADAYEGWYNSGQLAGSRGSKQSEYLTKIFDIREYDVPFHIRVMIDREIRCSFWYEFTLENVVCTELVHLTEKLDKADLRIMAFDIETTKSPLKFPDSAFDQVMMISYIVDGQGFLITNRQVVGEDVQNFEYAPKPEYDVGVFTVFNEPDEPALLRKFFDHICETKPTIFTTFNGDKFDWPFIKARADFHKISMEREIGVSGSDKLGSVEFSGRFASHMDCFYWVERDAYLPQGSHGLKAVTKAKLGYDPVELDPELMLPYARERPQELAEYSVSDSVATYFLYMKMIHDFIFALCTIIPTYPDEVLRRGSGTLCENLLMAQAFRGNIIFPNKQQENPEQYYNGKLIDSQTYIGGHVECLQNGVYRSDIPVKFKLEKAGYQHLIDQVTKIMDFALEVENSGISKHDVENYDDIKLKIVSQLEALKQKCPSVESEPLIYHVDVAAMYPNIILSNRLQPVAIVDDSICAGCLFNKEESDCKRKMEWQWKGDVFPLNKGEYEQVKARLQQEEEVLEEGKQGTIIEPNKKEVTFQEKLRARVKKYCSTSYKKNHQTIVQLRTDTVCMRENPFYVDTVRDFRDRRYEFKRLVKVWGDKLKAAKGNGGSPDELETCANRINLYESLQLAHKIILNSFYGYVMRRGARWYSMEMAAMVTHTGGNIIMDTRSLFDQIGMPLELDTDGIWTCLPKTFPEHFTFQLKGGKKVNLDFICTMCNQLIYDKYANRQYQTLVDKETLTYEKRLEMSVFFEIDGPYKAFIIPSSTQEGKMLKKRYAVFNQAGRMTEIKGFELKRRGELNIIKIFQSEVFSRFLEGKTLQECYDACGDVAKRWYDILESKGEYVNDSELIDYICECRVLQKRLADYGTQKSTSITCARRLQELLGKDIVKDKSLNVKFIISRKPESKQVTERAIPTVVFETDEAMMKKFLRKWTEDTSMEDFDIRSLLDWDYYKERLAGTIQKIVTIPAAMQSCLNPVPSIEYPEWLNSRLKTQKDKYKQKGITTFFKTADLEDLAKQRTIAKPDVLRPQQTQAKNVQEQKPQLSMENCPTPDENFASWLKHQKSNWRSIRQKMKQEKKSLHQFGSVFTKTQLGKQASMMKNFMHNMDETVLNSNWHVVSVDQTLEPGMLKVWAMTEQGVMFNVKLSVPKTIFINSRIEKTDPDFKKVTRAVLPRNRKVHNLYEWEASEDVFLNSYKNIKYKHLMNPNTEGIYETKLPIRFKAIIELSTIVRPIKRMIPQGQQAIGRVFRLQELENVISDTQYMPSTQYQRIYLGHSHNGQRHFWALAIQATKEIHFFIVNPANVNKTQGVQNLELIFNNTIAELGLGDTFADWQVATQLHVKELHQAMKVIEQRLQDYKQKTKQATVLVVHTDLTNQELQSRGLQSVANDFPVVRCPIVASDNEYTALQWIPTACKNITIRFTDVEEWLEEQVNLSRYSLIPVCNLGDKINVIDTLYSRSLHKNKHLLWYSDTSLPDLGGNEDRNYRIYSQEEIGNPEFNKPGFYRSYVVEIALSSLALNTIFQSEFLQEFEDATMYAQSGTAKAAINDFDTDFDEFVTCKAAFAKLKELCSLWFYDVEHNSDSYADGLLCHFYKWLTSSTEAKMYDPMLHRLVQKLMKKNFLKLLFELKQLGCTVIHGNFHRLFVQTTKRDFDEAETHINFVISKIQEKPLFKYISLQPTEYWKILLFKDAFNFVGIKESNPQVVAFNYDVCLHLPEAVQSKFRNTACEFILKVINENNKLKDTPYGREAQLEAEFEKIKDFMDTAEDYEKEQDHDFITKLITQYFCKKLLRDIDNFMQKKVFSAQTEASSSDEASEEDEEDRPVRTNRRNEKWEFPQRISSHHNYQDPALEFVKMICAHVFGLDPAFEFSTASLKRSLLARMKKSEYSAKVTQGVEPSLILVVPDVVCDSCLKSADLDICREQLFNEGGDLEETIWPCTDPDCRAPLNKVSIERRLIELLNRRMVAYQLQDVRCRGCKMVSNQLIPQSCSCTGTFEPTIGFEQPAKFRNQNLLNQETDIRLFVRLLKNFAHAHQMHLLKDTTEGLLSLIRAQ